MPTWAALKAFCTKETLSGPALNIDFRSLGVRLEMRHLPEHGIEGGLDGLDVSEREGRVDVLVWSGHFLLRVFGLYYVSFPRRQERIGE